jgi:Domain of unknown function (DUF4160)
VPQISFFYGITIYMYWRDHPPAHFHAQYGEHWASITVDDGHVLSGSLPPRALRMVREWRRVHQAELDENWRLVQTPLAPAAIDPLP